MRCHSTIVRQFGAIALGRALQAEGLDVGATTPQRWADRDSIPNEYWAAIARLGIATLDELAAAAETRRTRPDIGASAHCSLCNEARAEGEVAACTAVDCPLREREAA